MKPGFARFTAVCPFEPSWRHCDILVDTWLVWLVWLVIEKYGIGVNWLGHLGHLAAPYFHPAMILGMGFLGFLGFQFQYVSIILSLIPHVSTNKPLLPKLPIRISIPVLRNCIRRTSSSNIFLIAVAPTETTSWRNASWVSLEKGPCQVGQIVFLNLKRAANIHDTKLLINIICRRARHVCKT